MKKSTRVLLAVTGYVAGYGVCVALLGWAIAGVIMDAIFFVDAIILGWAIAGVIFGAIFLADAILCWRSGIWKYYKNGEKVEEPIEINQIINGNKEGYWEEYWPGKPEGGE